jgi:hypothetical protein
MNGTLAIAGKLFGLLQQDTGDNMIDLIGPIEVVAGDDLDLVLTVTDDEDARENLSALVDDDIRVRISDSDGGAAVVEYTIGSGVTLSDQTVGGDTEGQATITIPAADTARAAQLYYLEASVKLGGKRQHVVASRPFTIKPAIAAVVAP